MAHTNIKKAVVESEEDKRKKEMVESIATNISELAKAVRLLLGGKLKKKALVLLLAHSSSNSQRAVEEILSALENLETDWLNK